MLSISGLLSGFEGELAQFGVTVCLFAGCLTKMVIVAAVLIVFLNSLYQSNHKILSFPHCMSAYVICTAVQMAKFS